jgi:YggT family protein
MYLIEVIDMLFMVYMIMLFTRILSSWIPELQGTQLMAFVSYYTDPYLSIFRKIIPPLGMMDLSPIVAFLALGLIEGILKGVVSSLF